MALKVDYYTSLLRAVGDLDRDAYAARGAIYEREHKALMRLLYSADPPRSEAEIEREQQAFREAVRRVEFGNDQDDITLTPFSVPANAVHTRATASEPPPPAPQPPVVTRFVPAPAATAVPAATPPPTVVAPPIVPRAAERIVPPQPTLVLPQVASIPEPERAPAPDVLAEPAPAPDEDAPPVVIPKRKPIVGFLTRRMVLAIVLLAVGALGYGQATGEFELPWLADLVGDGTVLRLARNPDVQQAIVFDGDTIGSDASRAAGMAVWRLRTEATDPQATDPSAVLELELEIPERHIIMTLSMRREAPGSAMSHLFEVRFLRPDQQPDGDIANIIGVYMTAPEGTRRGSLLGRVLRVAPGVFLFGLAGADSERTQNLRNLKELPWIAIPLTYRNGFNGTLLVEKGAAGERAINGVLAKWGS